MLLNLATNSLKNLCFKGRIKYFVFGGMIILLVFCSYKSFLSDEPFDSSDVNQYSSGRRRKSVDHDTQQGLSSSSFNELNKARHQLRLLKMKIQTLENRMNVPNREYPYVPFLNYKNRKRILITGGAGFVGSHLVDHLMKQGHEIIVVDNYSTGRKRNIENWFGHKNFELILDNYKLYSKVQWDFCATARLIQKKSAQPPMFIIQTL